VGDQVSGMFDTHSLNVVPRNTEGIGQCVCQITFEFLDS
jgi:hypothetical protein